MRANFVLIGAMLLVIADAVLLLDGSVQVVFMGFEAVTMLGTVLMVLDWVISEKKTLPAKEINR